MVGKTKRGKGTKIIPVADGASLPIAISVGSASPHEVRLTEEVLEAPFIEEKLRRLIDDRPYDSDPLDEPPAQTDVGYIRHPDLIDICDLKSFDPIGIARMIVSAVGGRETDLTCLGGVLELLQ